MSAELLSKLLSVLAILQRRLLDRKLEEPGDVHLAETLVLRSFAIEISASTTPPELVCTALRPKADAYI